MTNADLTHLCLVVDRSGSMQSIAGDMNGAIKALLAKQDEEPGTLRVDVTTFDSAIEFPFTDAEPSMVTDNLIEPRGTTALLDAVGLSIARLGKRFSLMAEEDRPGTVIVVIVTDGKENASMEYNRAQINAMVTEQTDKWGWTFMYLAANVDAFATGADMGIPKGSTIAFAANAGSTRSVYDATNANIGRTRSGLAAEYTDEEREAAME